MKKRKEKGTNINDGDDVDEHLVSIHSTRVQWSRLRSSKIHQLYIDFGTFFFSFFSRFVVSVIDCLTKETEVHQSRLIGQPLKRKQNCLSLWFFIDVNVREQESCLIRIRSSHFVQFEEQLISLPDFNLKPRKENSERIFTHSFLYDYFIRKEKFSSSSSSSSSSFSFGVDQLERWDVVECCVNWERSINLIDWSLIITSISLFSPHSTIDRSIFKANISSSSSSFFSFLFSFSFFSFWTSMRIWKMHQSLIEINRFSLVQINPRHISFSSSPSLPSSLFDPFFFLLRLFRRLIIISRRENVFRLFSFLSFLSLSLSFSLSLFLFLILFGDLREEFDHFFVNQRKIIWKNSINELCRRVHFNVIRIHRSYSMAQPPHPHHLRQILQFNFILINCIQMHFDIIF